MDFQENATHGNEIFNKRGCLQNIISRTFFAYVILIWIRFEAILITHFINFLTP